MFHYENKLNETPIISSLNLLDHIWNITSYFIFKIRHDSLGMKSLKLIREYILINIEICFNKKQCSTIMHQGNLRLLLNRYLSIFHTKT